MDVTIVLPCYNEQDAIAVVVDDIKQVMGKTGYSYEIIVVDDASTDNTASVVRNMGVSVITRKRQGGSGASRKTGILAAHGDIIVMLDCDGSYDAEDIPKLLEYMPEYDQVIGWRRSEKGTLKALRFSAKLIIRKIASYLAKTQIPDLNSGIRALKRDVVLEYFWAIPNGFSCVSSMTLAFLCNDYSVKWVPAKYHKRIGYSKFHPIKDTFNYITTVIRIIAYFDPLRVFMPVSLILFFLGLLKTLQDIFIKVFPASLYVDVTLLLSSIMVFSLGLLAELIIVSRKR